MEIEIEIDLTPSKSFAEEPVAYDRPIELDLVDPAKGCSRCGGKVSLNEVGICRACHERTAVAIESASRERQAIPIVKAAEPFAAGEAIPAAPASSSLESALGGISAEGSAGANAARLGDVANGRASLGVGFSSAAGYVEALRRGVTRPTFESYVGTLRRTYKLAVSATIVGDHYTIKLDGEEFSERLIPIVSGSTETTDSHVNDGAIAKIKAEAASKKDAIAKINAEQALQNPLVAAPVVEDARITLRHGEMVAGAVAEGHGVLVGWTGKGPRTLAELTAMAVDADVPADAMPKPRDASAHARRAVQAFARGEVTIYTEDRGRKWRLERPVAGAQPGEKSGEVALVATLVGDSTLECTGDETLSIQVRAEFARLVDGQIFDAGEITTWLVDDVLKGVCNAAKYGGNWYVARRYRALAERVTSTFDGKWGRDWMNPALPIATTQQLAQGLARGLANEIDTIIAEVEEKRNDAKGKGKDDIGAGAATTAMNKLRKAAERVVAYGSLLGEQLVADCRDRIRVEMEALAALTDDGIATRFALVWEEIEMDIKNSGGVL